jgi:hypothetical protein
MNKFYNWIVDGERRPLYTIKHTEASMLINENENLTN